VPIAAALNEALNDQLATVVAQRTLSLGVRWDFHEAAALKLQVDRVDVDAGSCGSFTNRQPGFERGGEATIASIAVDFVF
jgi:hypothetical protein